MTDQQTGNDDAAASAADKAIVDKSNEEKRSFDYAGEVAAHHACSAKLSLHDLIDANLHNFVGFAKAGATLGLTCDRIAGAAGCNPESLRRVFLGKLGKWAAFRARIQTNGDPAGANPQPPKSPSDAAGQTGFARVW